MNKRKAQPLSRTQFYDFVHQDYTSILFFGKGSGYLCQDRSLFNSADNKNKLNPMILKSSHEITNDTLILSNIDKETLICSDIYTFNNGLHALVCTACLKPTDSSLLNLDPVYIVFIIYHDGKNIRAYIPNDGNFKNRDDVSKFPIVVGSNFKYKHDTITVAIEEGDQLVTYRKSTSYEWKGLSKTIPNVSRIIKEIESSITISTTEERKQIKKSRKLLVSKHNIKEIDVS